MLGCYSAIYISFDHERSYNTHVENKIHQSVCKVWKFRPRSWPRWKSRSQNEEYRESNLDHFTSDYILFHFSNHACSSFTLYALLVKIDTPRMFAGYYLFYHVSQKMLLTNNGINFFLYITSGQKFRTDLLKLFQCKRDNVDNISRFAGCVKGSDESDAKRFRSRNRTLLKK